MHEITKIRREAVRRELTVASKTHITPRMLRIVFQASDLLGFDSPSPDDHVKIFLPVPAGTPPIMRDFTPRAWDEVASTFTLDFALHAKGPATEWAANAKAGDRLSIGGPRGSTVVADDFDWYLLVGDNTALPSIGRRLETLRSNVPVTVIALVADQGEQQEFATNSSCRVDWVNSTGNVEQDALRLRAALEQIQMPNGDGFVWIAAEASVARELYHYVVDTMKHPKEWVKAKAYWSYERAGGEEAAG